jgi:membrane-associated phospholipid phosphatase
MDPFSLLAKGFLTFSHATIMVPLLITGLLTGGGFFIKAPSSQRRMLWGNICLLVLFTMIYNLFLKSLFLVPLNPALGIKGFAFPSGHMHVSAVLYGALFLAYPYLFLRIIFLIILAGIGYGLVYEGYHTFIDVAGAVGFALITLYLFIKGTRTPFIQKNPAWFGFCLVLLAGVMMVGIALRTALSFHSKATFMGLVTFSILWWAWQTRLLHIALGQGGGRGRLCL